MKVRICFIVTVPVTIRAFFIPQLRYLADNGFDVSVVCSMDKSLQKEMGDAIAYYPMEIPRGISFEKSVKAIKELTKFFRIHNFDIIQYSTPNAALYASVAGRIAHVRVRNYHIMGFRYFGEKGLLRYILKQLERISCKSSTHIECVSKSNLEIGVKERIFKRSKATVVWNGSTGGVDLERFDYHKRSEFREDIRNRYGFADDDFVFGFVGRITRDKGINELLAAFSEIKNAKLLIIGPIEGASTLDETLYNDSLTSPHIIYTGSVDNVEKYYAAIDALVLPSYREGFGNVVIEAAAMGTPAIVSNIPGPIDAIRENETALVVEVKSTKSLLSAMEKIRFMNYEEMGRHAEQYARENFDSRVLCQEILRRKKELL